MNATSPPLSNFLTHLQSQNQPFGLRRDGSAPEWSDADLHQQIYDRNPELYALLSLAEAVRPWQRVRVLFQLLRTTRVGMSVATRQTLDRVTRLLLSILHPDQVLAVFLAVRRVRANHKHTTRAILQYIFDHPQLEDLVQARRPAIVDCLEHAMGKNVARACAKMLAAPAQADPRYLHRHLLKFVQVPQQASAILPLLYQSGLGRTGQDYGLLHTRYMAQLYPPPEIPTTVSATNRGNISATLVHLYRGGASAQLQQALTEYVHSAARGLPSFAGTVAVVLDASASTRGYGQREYCCISQSVALQMVLQQCCNRVFVHSVGGSGAIPQPSGTTDLAKALLDALENQPDLVAIVSDGYENRYAGDLARIVATLPQLGISTPVVFCHSKFTDKDDLNLRQPAAHLPQLEFWHQNDFEPLLLSLFAMAEPRLSEPYLHQYLLNKLNSAELRLSSAISEGGNLDGLPAISSSLV